MVTLLNGITIDEGFKVIFTIAILIFINKWNVLDYCIFFRLDDYVHVLEKEVNIDYCRSMNKIIFDKTVTNDSETFAFVQLPEPEPEQVPERGKNGFSAVTVTWTITLTLHMAVASITKFL